jgi:hypothetical protein
MNDELSARERAVSFRLAGCPGKQICSALGRDETGSPSGGTAIWRPARRVSTTGREPTNMSPNASRPIWSGPSSRSAAGSTPTPRRRRATA